MTDVLIGGVRYIPHRKPASVALPLSQLMLEARLKRNETLEVVAKKIGTTKSHLWMLEGGGCMPRLPMLQKVLDYYGISFSEIEQQE